MLTGFDSPPARDVQLLQIVRPAEKPAQNGSPNDEKEKVMKRASLILTLVAAASLLLGSQAQAMTATQAMAVQLSQQAVAYPGHYSRGHHGYYRQQGHYGPRHHYRHFRGPVVAPVRRPPVIVYPYVQPYTYYYGSPGGISVHGRNWGFSFGF